MADPKELIEILVEAIIDEYLLLIFLRRWLAMVEFEYQPWKKIANRIDNNQA